MHIILKTSSSSSHVSWTSSHHPFLPEGKKEKAKSGWGWPENACVIRLSGEKIKIVRNRTPSILGALEFLYLDSLEHPKDHHYLSLFSFWPTHIINLLNVLLTDMTRFCRSSGEKNNQTNRLLNQSKHVRSVCRPNKSISRNSVSRFIGRCLSRFHSISSRGRALLQ